MNRKFIKQLSVTMLAGLSASAFAADDTAFAQTSSTSAAGLGISFNANAGVCASFIDSEDSTFSGAQDLELGICSGSIGFKVETDLAGGTLAFGSSATTQDSDFHYRDIGEAPTLTYTKGNATLTVTRDQRNALFGEDNLSTTHFLTGLPMVPTKLLTM